MILSVVKTVYLFLSTYSLRFQQLFFIGSRARNNQNPNEWDTCILIDEGEYDSRYSAWYYHHAIWKKEFCLATGYTGETDLSLECSAYAKLIHYVYISSE